MNQPVYAGQAAPRPKASKASVWSLILGILSITCLWILGSIPAIILGVMGMKKADADPTNVGGRGMALAGLITGCVGIIAGITPIAIASSLALPSVQASRERAYQSKELNHMRQTLLAMRRYAADFDGNFPNEITDVVKEGYIEDEYDLVLYTPESNQTKGPIFLYRSGFTETSQANEPILLSQKEYVGGKRVVGFVAGHVKVMRRDELIGIVEKFE